MLKREYKALLYIYRHQPVPLQEVYWKFPDFKSYKLNDMCVADSSVPKYDTKGRKSGEYEISIDANYIVTRAGEEYIEHKQQQFMAFALPYGITTAIAVAALVAQFIDIFG